MCGLWGMISRNNIDSADFDALRSVGYLSAFRGTDSTGVIVVPTKKPAVVVKEKLEPAVFLYYSKYLNSLEPKQLSMVLGHNRAATIGGVTIDNAHPVRHGSLIGTHNGTITFLGDPKKDISDTNDFYSRLSKLKTIEERNEFIKEVNKKNGAFAFVWYDTDNDTVNIIRNNKRPLHYVTARGVLYYASEEVFLTLALSRNGPNIYSHEVKSFKPGVLYTAKRGQMNFTETEVFSNVPFVSSVPAVTSVGGRTFGTTEASFVTNDMVKKLTTPVKAVWDIAEAEIVPPSSDEKKAKETKWQKRKREKQERALASCSHGHGGKHSGTCDTSGTCDNGDDVAYLHPFRSQVMSLGEVLMLTELGCCMCGEVPDINDLSSSDSLFFFDEYHFICYGCHSTKENTIIFKSSPRPMKVYK